MQYFRLDGVLSADEYNVKIVDIAFQNFALSQFDECLKKQKSVGFWAPIQNSFVVVKSPEFSLVYF